MKGNRLFYPNNYYVQEHQLDQTSENLSMLKTKPIFIPKLSIALKEANETEYWLDLLVETKYISDSDFQSIEPKIIEI